MNYQALSNLIKTHPTWPVVTDDILVDWVNEEAISVEKTAIPNETILAVVLSNRAEFAALSEGDKQIVRDILYIGDSVPTAAGAPARDTLVAIFGAQSQTVTDLAAEINTSVSRAFNAGILGEVRKGDVEYARTLII